LKNRLVITLTTVHGSRQYSLNQLARVAVVVFLVLAAISFFVSNPLLLITSGDLQELESDHQQLSEDYAMMLGSQQLYKSELDNLSLALTDLQSEKEQLQQENMRIGEINETLDHSLLGLEALLGLPASEEIDEERAQALTVMANQRLFFLHSIPNGLPIQSERITDRYGTRIHPVLKKRQMHHGIDFKADIGTPVYATADGVIEFAGYHKQSGYGKLVIMQHNFGFKTYYGHLNSVRTNSRAFVRKGELIGYSGNTGVSTGPHLHYEVRHLYTPLDPAPFLSWSITDFDSLFSKVKDVKWASLQEMYPLNLRTSPVPPSLPREISSAER
jgi:murein DD-endopeptidase MepM/ murein hydrolase activator NlpD